MSQSTLFQKYCLDACGILDFWEESPKTRPYHVKVKSFRVIWERISAMVSEGSIVIPRAVADEVGLVTKSSELQEWIEENKPRFVPTAEIADELGKIVNKHQIYTTNKGSFGDAVLMATALNRGLTIITSEILVSTPSLVNPKIPNVCNEFGIKWMHLPEFFEAEGL